MTSNTLKLSLIDIERETPDSAVFYFTLVQGALTHFYPGQFLTFLLSFDGHHIRRSYSICTSPSQLPLVGIGVKRIPKGLASNYLLTRVAIGDEFDVLAPYGTFTLNTNRSNLPNLVLWGAGSGVTPLVSIAKTALEKSFSNNVCLIYGNRDEEHVMFKRELGALQRYYPNRFELIHVFSQSDGGWQEKPTRIDREVVATLYQAYKLEQDIEANHYLCGPEGMMHVVWQTLLELGCSVERMHRESFYQTPTSGGAYETQQLKPVPSQRIVLVTLEGQTHSIVIKQGEYILDAILDQGLDVPYSCQVGICGSCRAFKVQGEVYMHEPDAITDRQMAQGQCLTCVAQPLSDDVIIDYDVRLK